MIGLMIESTLNAVPLWAWITMVVLAGAAIFYFFSPILLPIWAAMPKPLKVGLGVVGAVLAAWVGGKHAGRKTEKEIEAKRSAQAIANRREINNEIRDTPRSDVDKRLDKWMRDK